MQRTRLRPALAVALVVGLGLFTACGKSAEGDSCDLTKGNEDCESGLVCRGGWEVRAGSPVCCPAPPAKPDTSACEPRVKYYTPDPSVDAAPIPPGSGGSAGAAGSGGAAGSDGSAGAAGSDGAAGSGGSAGAGTGGSAGASPNDAGDAAVE